jgi:ferredoxin
MNDENSNPQDDNSKQDDSQKIIVKDSCIGCGICATIAPDVFEMNPKTGKSEIKKEADLSNLDKAKEAAAACPVEAIEVKE